MLKDLIQHGGYLTIVNKYGDTPLDKCRRTEYRDRLEGISVVFINCEKSVFYCVSEYGRQLGLDMRKIAYKDQSSMSTRMRTSNRLIFRWGR